MGFEKMNYLREWYALSDRYEQALRDNPEERWARNNSDQYLRQALGAYKLKCFAERLRCSPEAIWKPLDPLEALRLYLINKHHWRLEHVRLIVDDEDFLYLLREEVLALKLSPAEAEPVWQSAQGWGTSREFAAHFAQPAL
ncbi:hypothetical protein LCH33_004082 [Pseudomonas amygdali]|uniref:Uncharacterized protein n=2 Tax=Pseudomonas syringae group TaxID=136849 RepID=A0A2K4WFX3_9PSED|nr:hypothetical protein [Pseudomonas amygdali]KPX54592.1 Uncharacterized protein ALO67_04104 [Pseudomonas amygdali pv. hibisci]RMN60836.1 hypothetical protein ALQ57_01839 [Pseudomonas amygdali pv. hibisci]UBT80654.1 hypothetical protein LCH33_004082 [Pseudomonas amygdali]SOS34728.1 hypothetical protein CFBP6411_03371 [Pseudomonas syringae group genomosp. 3]